MRARLGLVLRGIGLTLAVAEGLLRASYPAPTRHYVWPPYFYDDMHLPEAGARRVAELVVGWILGLSPTLRARV